MGGEADLVVDDDVDGAADAVAAGLRHLEGLHHHALASEGRIAVQNHRRHQIAGVVPASVLARPHRAGNHRADDLQVRGIEGQCQVHLAPRRHDVGGKTLVVLHVAAVVRLRHDAVELVEQIARVLAQNVHQHVQPTAVGHADHRLHHAVAAEPLQRLVEHADEALAALQAEALGAGILGMQVAFQALGGAQAIQNGEARVRRKRRRGLDGLQALPQPRLLRSIGDVHVLGADCAAVGALQGGDDVPQGSAAMLEQVLGTGIEDGIEIRLAEAVVAERQLRRRFALPKAEGIEPGFAVAAVAIGADELQHPHLAAGVGRFHLGADALRARLEAVPAQPFEVPQHVAVGHVGAVGGWQGFEAAAPLGRHLGRILEVRLEQRFEVGIARRQVGAGAQAFEMRRIHRVPRASRRRELVLGCGLQFENALLQGRLQKFQRVALARLGIHFELASEGFADLAG